VLSIILYDQIAKIDIDDNWQLMLAYAVVCWRIVQIDLSQNARIDNWREWTG